MASKSRPGSAKGALGNEAARLRSRAPGKRFIGGRAGQARQARRQELERVVRMAEQHRREVRDDTSVTGILVELFVGSVRLASSLLLAPGRILEAVRRGRRAGA